MARQNFGGNENEESKQEDLLHQSFPDYMDSQSSDYDNISYCVTQGWFLILAEAS